MSKTLIIRHLPISLSLQDKEKLLRHFGADKVWESSQKRNYLFASFNSVEKAKESLGRLHQLEIAKRRLVVEYSFDKVLAGEPVTQAKIETEETSNTTKLVKEFLRVLNAWSPSIDFYQPPPPHLNYKYPDITPQVAINMIHSLFNHKPLYTQTLHLMNKMSLSSPFKENNKALIFFKEIFSSFFIPDQPSVPSETESEMSSDETIEKIIPVPLLRRKRKLPVPSRKIRVRPTPSAAKVKKINQEEVFEKMPVEPKTREISIVVHQELKPSEEPALIGELGKFDKLEQPETEETPIQQSEELVLSKLDLVKNRLSYRDMKALPVFKNYRPGEPSMRLYIKNLAKTVTEQDLKSIYKRYVEGLTDEEITGFDVRVMQEGRMKGQAFVTFPNEELAEIALNESNGYMLKDKPMVVQFARAANKKTVE